MSELASLMLLLALVLAATKFAGYLSIRIGQPAVFGKILLGLLLGPTFFNILNWHIGTFYLFGGPAEEAMLGLSHAGGHGDQLLHTFHMLAEIGVLLLMFIAGLETDLRKLRSVGKVALLAALGGVVLPLGLGIAVTLVFIQMGLPFSLYAAVFVGTILTATSVSISAQTLMELGQLRSKEGSAILGAAVIDDVIGIIILSFVVAFRPATGGAAAAPETLLDFLMLSLGADLSAAGASWLRILLLLVLMAVFFAIALTSERWLVRPLLRRFEALPIAQSVTAAALLLGFIYAWAAEWIGNVAAITGSYIAGVLIARTKLHSEVDERLNVLAFGFFVPVFFVGIGLQADARPVFSPLLSPATMALNDWLVLLFTIVIIAAAIVSKVWGGLLGARLGGATRDEGLRIGVGMISRGEVGIIIALVGLGAGVIDQTTFSIMVLMVLATTLVTPIWLKRVFAEDTAPKLPESTLDT